MKMIYDITEYNDRRLRRFNATQEEVDKLRCNQYDFVWDQELNEIAAITETGERSAIYNAALSMEELSWPLLETLLSQPGKLFTNKEIGRHNEKVMLWGLNNNQVRLSRRKLVDDLYNRNKIQGAISSLRNILFHDDRKKPYLIISNQYYQYAWHIDHTFLIIGAKREPSSSAQIQNPCVINSSKGKLRNFIDAIFTKHSNKNI